MWRHGSRPRKGWQDTVTQQGLIFPVTDMPDGSTTDYWNEAAWYEFTMAEVEALEAATEDLWALCVDAAGWMASHLDDARLGLPSGTLDLAADSMRSGDPSVYARFDLRYDVDGSIKMLEINGDTPTGLVETGVAQWRWVEDVMPEVDQWNSVHDRLVARWRDLRTSGAIPDGEVHFLYSTSDPSGEEEMTTHYMQDTAVQAGLRTYSHPIEEVGWNEQAREFRDRDDRPIRTAYKLYPWEVMLGEEFGQHLLGRREARPVRWIEPPWKVLLSTKAILPVLWERNPGHPLLLPSYFDAPGPLTEWVAKPLHGREGDNIRIHRADAADHVQPGEYGAEGWVYQQWAPLPAFDANYAVLGSWIVDGQAAGMLVRESDGFITDYYSRVVPHAIGDGLQPDAAQQQAWLAERAATAPVPSPGPKMTPTPLQEALDG